MTDANGWPDDDGLTDEQLAGLKRVAEAAARSEKRAAFEPFVAAVDWPMALALVDEIMRLRAEVAQHAAAVEAARREADASGYQRGVEAAMEVCKQHREQWEAIRRRRLDAGETTASTLCASRASTCREIADALTALLPAPERGA